MMNALPEGARFIAIGISAIAMLMIVGYWASILGLAASDRNFRLRQLLGLEVTAANDRPRPRLRREVRHSACALVDGPSRTVGARPLGEQPPAPHRDGVGCARERAARDS